MFGRGCGRRLKEMTREESIKIYKTYSRKLFNISFRIVGDSALAEEIMQDTLLKFIASADAFAPVPPLATGHTQPRRSEDGLGWGRVADRVGNDLRRSEDGLGWGRVADQAGDEPRRSGGRRELAWLTKTCVRASIDALRKMRREKAFLDEYAGEGIEEENGLEVDESELTVETGNLTVEKVKGAIRSLPEPYRLILTLVLIEGLDYEEISDITGEREGALRTRFSRARKMLAGRLRNGEG